MTKESFRNYLKRFKTEAIYLKDDTEDCLVRSSPGEGFFVKHRTGNESAISSQSDIVVRAVNGHKEVTKKVYDSYQ